jgi:AbrB family looped-hinge helix DNA binding protein
METVKVSQKYQVVIPKAIRRVLGINPGESIVMVENIKKMRGMAKGLTTKGLRDESERFN